MISWLRIFHAGWLMADGPYGLIHDYRGQQETIVVRQWLIMRETWDFEKLIMVNNDCG